MGDFRCRTIRSSPAYIGREEGAWRWMGETGFDPAEIARRSPSQFTSVSRYPAAVPARTVTVRLDGRDAARPGPSQALELYAIDTDPQSRCGRILPRFSPSTVDKTISPPGDIRELGLILTEAGFRK